MSPYEKNDVINSARNSGRLISILMSLVPEDKKKIAESILFDGHYNGYDVSSNLDVRNNPRIEFQRRISMLYLLITNPKTFDYFVKNKINVFHGTNGNALASITKNGVLSKKTALEKNIDVNTGEAVILDMVEPRDFISFTDVLDIAENYSGLTPKGGENDMSFEVIVGTSEENINQVRTKKIHSAVSEIGVVDKFPLDKIKVICVPSSKIEFVKKIIGNNSIDVLPIDGLQDKIYYMDSTDNYLFINEKDINRLLEKKEERVFTNDEVKKTVGKVSLRRIIEKLSELVTRKEQEYNVRSI